MIAGPAIAEKKSANYIRVQYLKNPNHAKFFPVYAG
jgi:hypothetical protein